MLIARGDIERGRGHIDQAADAYERLGDHGTGTPAVHMARASLALLRMEQGRFDEARALASEAVAAAREGFSPIVSARAHHARGRVRLVDGDDPGARTDLERACTFYADSGVRRAVVTCRIELSRLAERVGDLERALAEIEAAVEAGRVESAAAELEAWQRLAELAERRGDAARQAQAAAWIADLQPR